MTTPSYSSLQNVHGTSQAGDGSADSEPPQRSPAERLFVSIVHEEGGWQVFGSADGTIEAAARAVAAALPLPETGAAVTVALADDGYVQELNRRFRGRDVPTNVLSFPPAASMPSPPDAPVFLGDIVLAAGTILREADGQSRPPAHHLAHLTVHGLLHLLGYGHETVEEAVVMESLEARILAGLGIPDPYADTETGTGSGGAPSGA